MKEREMKLRAVIAWCMACGWSVTDFHLLFSRIYNVIHYRRLWTDADTPKGTALAAQSRDDAIKDLHTFMKARCFPDEIRLAVVWLYNH
jgi:hypothetical protein